MQEIHYKLKFKGNKKRLGYSKLLKKSNFTISEYKLQRKFLSMIKNNF